MLIAWERFSSTERKIVNLLLQGWGPIKIATSLSEGNYKNFRAIRTRSASLRQQCKIKKYPPKIADPILEIITKQDLPDWYELGWVVASFDGEKCTMQWLRRGMPPKPGGQNACDARSNTLQ